MPWFKVDDGLASALRTTRIPRAQRAAAMGLWILAGSWCARELTDGLVPEHMLSELACTKKQAEALVAAGYWMPVDGGWQMVDWAETQPTRAEVEEKRRKGTEKVANWRAKQRGSNPVTRSVTNRVGNPAPDPTRPDPTTPSPPDGEEGGSARGGAPPSPFCSKHPEGTDGPCRACGNARMAHDLAVAAEKSKPTPMPRRPKTCAVHAEYPLPCDRCAIEAAEAAT
ncbi:hypothetical protein AB0O90_04420 [Microbacterium testaceum]|uniref:hypothetical protein n=1 Tax=Microbacterium testaceum TaxID=2033 RepID=UPI00342F8580